MLVTDSTAYANIYSSSELSQSSLGWLRVLVWEPLPQTDACGHVLEHDQHRLGHLGRLPAKILKDVGNQMIEVQNWRKFR